MNARALACLSLALAAPLAAAQMDGSEYVKVNVQGPLVSQLQGDRFFVAVNFALGEGWHIYWKNPGDSGAPPSFDWTLPEGFQVVSTRWQAPHRIVTGGITSYGFDGGTSMIVEVKAPASFKAGDKFAYTLETNYLVCKDLCLPGSAKVSGEFAVPDSGSRILIPVPTPGKQESTSHKTEGDNVALTFDVPQLAGLTVSNSL
jgi:thiol:disulfide interchange protein DsbD